MARLIVTLGVCTTKLSDGPDDIVLENVHQGIMCFALGEQLGCAFSRPHLSRLESALDSR